MTNLASTRMDRRRPVTLAAMNRGVRAALRRQPKRPVNPGSTTLGPREEQEIVVVPPEQIPDFPEDDEPSDGPTQPG